ncbi:TfoX/Sxy family protein [Microbacterium ureisolvens]|uniref:TfoX/Sxy family protein n=1 Tax=Microbacterium ureisolvens TaxID=2781186 RepID=UPI003627B536
MADKGAARRQKFPESYAIFDPIAAEWTTRPDVSIGAMFGSEGLNVRGKVFACVTFDGELMVKLPESRVSELAEAGEAQPVVMRGKPMREWATVGTDAAARWPEIIAEAYAHVDAITP